jgi:hypothetical protein
MGEFGWVVWVAEDELKAACAPAGLCVWDGVGRPVRVGGCLGSGRPGVSCWYSQLVEAVEHGDAVAFVCEEEVAESDTANLSVAGADD